MADQHSSEGSSSSDVSGHSSESTLEINIKTLDSQIYCFHVDKNMLVSVFKEKIASQTGIPVGQQRLIFRGKVLKDDHLLSEYHVENGNTLHLVVRQPSQQQATSSTGEATNNGQEPNIGGLRNRVGQISHTVVLGTFNIGDQGGGVVPDLSRDIGAVLNSIGVGNQVATSGTGVTQPRIQPSQGNAAEGTGSNINVQSQAWNQSHSGQAFPGQSLPQVLQMPLGSAIPIPSLNAPIPDSVNTLSEFINRMEMALSQNVILGTGFQPEQSSGTEDIQAVNLPTNNHGLSTPEALSIVMRRAQQLLGNHAIVALSHIAGRLEHEGNSTVPTVRDQIQTESVQVGLAMQHLGSLLLELGRTILTLRMGQSPAESSVNGGPAVYISPSGPNPIMVQPFPLQTSSLFGGATTTPSSGVFGPGGTGNVPRHINIHIHTGASLVPMVSTVGSRGVNGEQMQGGNVDGSHSGELGHARVLPARNFTALVPSRPTVVSASGAPQPGVSVSPSPNSVLPSLSELNSQVRSVLNRIMGENQASSGQSERSTVQDHSVGPGSGNDDNNPLKDITANEIGDFNKALPGSVSKDVSAHCPDGDSSSGHAKFNPVMDSERGPRSNSDVNDTNCSVSVPLGLGVGGLQPKVCYMKWNRHPKSQGKGGDGGTSSDSQQPRTDGQEVSKSFSSVSSQGNVNISSSDQLLRSEGHSNDGQLDAAGVMSQVLNGPALDGLLTGVSRQTGVGSPDVLRNMLRQLTQSPAMMNTVNQIAQQIESQDLGSGQGDGIDMSRMFQQMLPIVSQALGHGGLTVSEQSPAAEPEVTGQGSVGHAKPADQNSQIEIQNLAQRIEGQDKPGNIFHTLLENAANLYNDGRDVEDIVNELCTNESLAKEFLEMLHGDISDRLQREKGFKNP